jgi:anti-sigma factor RsiW
MTFDDAIPEHDLNAFIDGELDAEARRRVQAHLARHPEMAARVMADMAIAQSLAAAGPPPASAPAETRRLAVRLQAALGASPARRASVVAAVLALTFALGWALGNSGLVEAPALQAPPPFVDEALMSHRTALLRARMESQPEVTAYDPAEIRSATRIVLPPVPRDWRVTDVQVFPSDEGPSVGVAFVTPGGPVSLFAFHVGKADWIAPTIAQRGRNAVSYWQSGDLAFALIGPTDEAQLRRIAGRLTHAAPARSS